jgi:pimeloyl-ACP methyl ester carboxylesterase
MLGGWCWEKVAPMLEAEGHRVVALDLPGHGEDNTAVSGMTLDANVARVLDAVGAADAPVILVGHSMGGVAITQAAEGVPDRIATLVYVSGVLPQDGESAAGLALHFDPHTAASVQVNESAGTWTLPDEALRDAAFGECDEEDAAFALRRAVPESRVAFGAPVSITPERAGRVPRVYIECLRDRTITIDGQRAMQQAGGCEQVLTIDTDHSPFLSRPRELADDLLTLAH